MKENKTRYVILGLLNHQNCSGYDIKNRIDVALSHFWSVGFGQIYPTLKSLESEELIIHCDSTYDHGPERKIYQITKKGREELKRWIDVSVEKEDVRYEILLKLFFGAVGNEQDAIKHISDFKKRNTALLGNVTGMKNELKKIMNISKDHQYYYLTALFGSKIYKAYIEWAEEAEVILNQASDLHEQKGVEKNV